MSTPRLWRVGRVVIPLVVTATLITGLAPLASADPPNALPANADAADLKWQPAFDYDSDGCYPTPAIGRGGKVAPGLETSGALNGHCHDRSDLSNTNSYSRSKCNHDWCAYLYDLYFEKDQVIDGVGGGHRHDIEHVVVWVYKGQAKYVSVSQHGNYATYPSSSVAWEGTHAKVVYHKDGVGTHDFRLAAKNEKPENDNHTWQYPALVSWNKFPPGIRDKLTSANFGEASLGIKNSTFDQNLDKAKPPKIPFVAYE